MALKINFGGMLVPDINKTYYQCTAFKSELLLPKDPGAQQPDVPLKVNNVKQVLERAWSFVTERAAKHEPCNAYYRTLAKHKTLAEILSEGDITLHCLWPKTRKGKVERPTFDDFMKMPYGNSAGRDIGIFPYLLLETKPEPTQLMATLIHELAHLAGATTDPDGKDSAAAEQALKYCLCGNHYDRDVVGFIHQIGLGRSHDSRVV